ncbi:MAG TPA: hypothetical protein VKE74_33450 [Gemmataceae bacterium]|nr:hypothetical protein [Gemmataceae bacterium]
MNSSHGTHRLPRTFILAGLALAAASCGQPPGAERPVGSQGERVWTKIDVNLEDTEARRVLTEENFAKIRDGMTLPEVAEALGVMAPTKKPIDSGCWVSWRGGDKKIAVHLAGGKVRGKEQAGLD